MADQIKANPIEVSLPVDIKLQAGKVDKSSFKSQLKELETFLGRQASTLEKSELKSKILVDTVNARQSLSLAAHGTMHAFDPRKMANAPNPSKVVSQYSDLVAPKNVGASGRDQLDKNILGWESEIKYSLDSLKMPLGKGASALATGKMAQVKKMGTIFNKIKKDQGQELDVNKFYEASNEYQRLLQKEGAQGEIPPKVLQQRIAQMRKLEEAFGARSKVSRHIDEEPLLGIGRSIVASAAKRKVDTVAKTTATNAIALTQQAIADAARDTALGIKAEVIAAKGKGRGQLGVSVGGGFQRSIDLGAAAMPGMTEGLSALFEQQLRAGGLGGIITPPKPPAVPPGGVGPVPGEPEDPIKRAEAIASKIKGVFSNLAGGVQNIGGSIGNLFINGLSKAIAGGMVGIPAMLAGGLVMIGAAIVFGVIGAIGAGAVKITQAIIGPIVSGFKEGISKTADTVRSLSLAMYPLVARGTDIQTAFKGISAPILELASQANAPLDVLAKMEARYTRITGSVKGLKEYMAGLLQYSRLTGEEVGSIDDAFLEIAQFFRVDVTKSGAAMVDHMTKVALTSNATSQELRMIAEWLMPAFAKTAGTAEEKMKGVLEASAKLAQVGLRQPRQLVQATAALEQFMSPTGVELGLLGTLGKQGNIFTGAAKGAQKAWEGTFEVISIKLQNLALKEDALRSSGKDFSVIKAALAPLENQRTLLQDELNSAFIEATGEGLKPGKFENIIKTLGTALEKNPVFARSFDRATKGSLRASITEMFMALSKPLPTAKSLENTLELQARDLGNIATQAENAYSIFFKFAGLKLAQPAQLAFFTTLRDIMGDLSTRFAAFMNLSGGDQAKDKGIFGLFATIGNMAGDTVTSKFGPAMKKYQEYLELIFSGGDPTKSAQLKKDMVTLFTGGVEDMMKLAAPLLDPIAEILVSTFLTVFEAISKSKAFDKIIEALKSAFTGLIKGLASDANLMSACGALGIAMGKAIFAGLTFASPLGWLVKLLSGANSPATKDITKPYTPIASTTTPTMQNEYSNPWKYLSSNVPRPSVGTSEFRQYQIAPIVDKLHSLENTEGGIAAELGKHVQRTALIWDDLLALVEASGDVEFLEKIKKYKTAKQTASVAF